MRAPQRLLLLIAALVLAPLRPAAAETLVVALSTDHVEISSSFAGTGITVFGAIERDGAALPRPVYDIVAVVRGPDETLVTRRKERVAGIWLNRAARTFLDMPSFYAVHSSRPLGEITNLTTLRRYQLGLGNLAFRSEGGFEAADDPAFEAAFVRLKKEAGLYRDASYGITFPGGSLFQTGVAIPANVPVGTYVVSVFLFADGVMLATGNAAFGIGKTGFEQFTFDLARENGYLYGLICVVLALVTGWLAAVLFRRD